MPHLVHKTRGDSSPQGKPRVYFSAHPADYEKYFESISDEILILQNCVIWYDDEPLVPYDEEDLFLTLSQMQLLVMPVTGRLLTEASRALDVEFRYAIEHHIPVLPLMQESGLEGLFNQKCGDLQFLTKQQKSETELPYEEKLRKFLSSVLIGDELAEKVRAAFDAYIFLSYRKKDRKYAQELMKLIHRNDYCRDIAIWYDEFLIPGEDFNAAIAEALQKSSLFALAVTPNLVNEQNYVMSTEYPMAKEAKKRILPVEMESTDRSALEENYSDIPECTNGKDEGALSSALLEALRNLALRENDDDPRHTFFIGLAYLSGLDVEVDHDRAAKLITSAADAGLPEAIQKLVFMYQRGEGVKRDYRAAVEWQRKLISAQKKLYEKEGTEESGIEYIEAIHTLGTQMYELRDLAQAEAVYEEMNNETVSLFTRFSSDLVLRHLSMSFSELARMRYLQGDLNAAREHCENALAFCEGAAKRTRDASLRRQLSAVYLHLYTIYEERRDFAKAEEYCRLSLEIRKNLLADDDSIRARRDVAGGYRSLGDLYFVQRNFAEAVKQYEEVYRLRKAIADELSTAESYRELSVCYGRLGDTYREDKNFAVAQKCYLSALNICKTLAQTEESYAAMRDLAAAYNSLGVLYSAIRNLSGAREYYTLALAELEKVAAGVNTLDTRRNLAVTYGNLGDICEETEEYDTARDYYLAALVILEAIAGETQLLSAKRELSDCYVSLGDVTFSLGDSPEACVYYRKAVAVGSPLADETKAEVDYASLALTFYKLSLIGPFEEQQGYLERAYTLWTVLLRQYPNNDQYTEYHAMARERLLEYAAEAETTNKKENAPAPKKTFFGKLIDRFKKQ